MIGGASYACRVLRGAWLCVAVGVNHGDPVDDLEALCPGDVYRLDPGAEPVELAIADAGMPAEEPDGVAGPDDAAAHDVAAGHAGAAAHDGTAGRAGAPVLAAGTAHAVAPGSAAGVPGAPVRLSARLTFLAADGHSLDVMALETGDRTDRETLLFPLGPMEAGLDYTLAGACPPDTLHLAEIVPFAFAAGTRITMGDGRLVAVERLAEGDVVLTRDGGKRPLRAVLARTERALGAFAPVVVPAGLLGNAGDLILSQHQRLLVYQRGPDRLTGAAEMLVRAGDLVDGERVHLRRGGFVDYVSLVLDRHEMLFAEGVAVESLEVNAATRPRLRDDQAEALAGLDHAPHYGTEAGRDLAAQARARLLGGKA